ncbi:predicted protein [Arabidopsis lyrata subsp. lyrata]|uniref:Predicted protein n=1 Tax=Arabidopsis lyrata subsp. lyrata TaxID=81972 RepID=D7KQY0_ARALL|nr:predicted protein [Arabidopsis lyrata subsp. lyrata]
MSNSSYPMDFVSDLNNERMNWKVHLKILSIWNLHSTPNSSMVTSMILVDEKANKIDAIIPNGLYRHNFKKNLKEGEWYFMSDFNVVPQNPISRYSWHPFMIQCKWETKMVHITPRSINNYMDFIDYDEIKYAGTQEKEYVTVDHLQSPRQMMIRWRKWILTKTKLGR